MISTKICTTCHIKKELSEFTKRKASKDGMRSCCKACQAKNGKRYYETNKEQIFEYQKQYSQNNKEKIAKRAKSGVKLIKNTTINITKSTVSNFLSIISNISKPQKVKQ